MRVYVHSGAATPLILVKAMTKHGMSSKLENVEVIHMVTGGNAEYAQPNFRGICITFFIQVTANCLFIKQSF